LLGGDVPAVVDVLFERALYVRKMAIKLVLPALSLRRQQKAGKGVVL
jgi:hypothetical protein